jgi:hypothetical protein
MSFQSKFSLTPKSRGQSQMVVKKLSERFAQSINSSSGESDD